MPSIRENQAPIMLSEPEIETRSVDLDGYTVSFQTFPIGSDPAPLFRGLPDDRCQCPHWGIVVTGQLDISYADSDESFVTGDAYYIAPGHLPRTHDATKVIEFSPTAELAKTMSVLGANMAKQEVTS